MQHSSFAITDQNAQRVAYELYNSYGSNDSTISKMRHILSVALKDELTERQRECLVMYYYKNMKMNEIASILSLSPSTVTRHIKAAEKKLKSVAKYC